MDTLSAPRSGGNIDVLARTVDLETLERAKFSDLKGFARWLVSRDAQYTGRGGFAVQVNGQLCYLVITRDDCCWRWPQIERSGILKEFDRAKRMAQRPLAPSVLRRSQGRAAS